MNDETFLTRHSKRSDTDDSTRQLLPAWVRPKFPSAHQAGPATSSPDERLSFCGKGCPSLAAMTSRSVDALLTDLDATRIGHYGTPISDPAWLWKSCKPRWVGGHRLPKPCQAAPDEPLHQTDGLTRWTEKAMPTTHLVNHHHDLMRTHEFSDPQTKRIPARSAGANLGRAVTRRDPRA